MNIKICVNEYLLVWYLLYGASLSEEIHKFKSMLWGRNKEEYNACYKDKSEILKYDKDFIPDNDTIYNMVFESDIYKKLKKEVDRHKILLMKIWDDDKRKYSDKLQEIIRTTISEDTTVFIIHPYMELLEYNNELDKVVWGSDKEKYAFVNRLYYIILRGKFNKYKKIDPIITDAILELLVLNEIESRTSATSTYLIGSPKVKLIKRQLYPYWLMYLGITSPEEMLNRMMEDKIVFDISSYQINKTLSKMNIYQFIEYCINNKDNVVKIDCISEQLVEVI